MTRTLRHASSICREEDGAVRFDDLIEKLKEEFVLYFAMHSQVLGECEFPGTRRRKEEKVSILLESRFIKKKILYFRAIQGHSGETFVDPLLQDNIYNIYIYIYINIVTR